MNNLKFLKSVGFTEKDGWLVNPYFSVDKEKIFKISDLEDKTLEWIIQVITASSFNAGVRWARIEERKQLSHLLESNMKKIRKHLEQK